MPKDTLLQQVDADDKQCLAEIFGLTNAGEYAEAEQFDGAAPLRFTLAATYGMETDNEDLKTVQYALDYVDVPTHYNKKNRRKKKGVHKSHLTADEILSTASYQDNKVAFELMDQLHPDLLLLMDQHFIPGPHDSIFDPNLIENSSRKQYVLERGLWEKPKKGEGNCLIHLGGLDYAYVDSVGAELVRGSAVDVFQYIVEMDRKECHRAYQLMCNERLVREALGGRENYVHLLKMFRHERSLAPSLDRLSKVTQNRRADRDAPYYWYNDVHLDHLVLHPSLPLQVKARYQQFEECDLEEFLLRNDDAAYVIDTTRGGIEGASSNDKNLLFSIFGSGKDAYIHAFLGMELVGHPIALINKPRAHNHTAVFFHNVELEPFTILELEMMLEDVRQANELRNSRYHGIFKTERNFTVPPQNLILDMVTYVQRLWQAADDVREVKIRKRRPPTEYLEDNYNELTVTFSQRRLPTYVAMHAPRGYYPPVTKPLRLFAKGDVAKQIQYNMIMTFSEGKRGYFFGEWWYIRHPREKPKQRYVVKGVEEKVYAKLSAPVPIPGKNQK